MNEYREKLEQWAKEKISATAKWNQHEKQYVRNMIFGAIMFAYRMDYINHDEKNELLEQYT